MASGQVSLTAMATFLRQCSTGPQCQRRQPGESTGGILCFNMCLPLIEFVIYIYMRHSIDGQYRINRWMSYNKRINTAPKPM